MDTVLGYMLVFLLTGYGFAFGCEFGYKRYLDGIYPRRIIEPQFRVVWSNPQTPERKPSK